VAHDGFGFGDAALSDKGRQRDRAIHADSEPTVGRREGGVEKMDEFSLLAKPEQGEMWDG